MAVQGGAPMGRLDSMNSSADRSRRRVAARLFELRMPLVELARERGGFSRSLADDLALVARLHDLLDVGRVVSRVDDEDGGVGPNAFVVVHSDGELLDAGRVATLAYDREG